MHSVVFNSGAINISYNKPRLNRVGINFSTYNAPNDLVPQLTGMNAVTLLVKGSRARKVGLEKIRRSIRDRKDILEGTTTESSHTLPYQWEYPGLKLLEKPFGRVDVTVTIFQRSEGANLFSYDQLMTAITDVYQGRYKAFNDDARKNAVTSGHIPTELYYYYPEDESWFHAKDINDNQWLNFNLVGKETHNVYALPISDRHFLMLDYHFDHSPKRGESELRKLGGAAADVEAIVNTMALSYAKVAEGVKTIGN